MPEGAVLGIFAKRPEPGRAKTRLAPLLGVEGAAAAAEAMLLDTLDGWGSDRFLAEGGRRVVVFDPPDAGPWFDERLPESLALQPQAAGDLGDRMRAFFEEEFADGATRVVAIGADSPTLDPSLVVSAFVCLATKDLVIGPATDGGYYLIGQSAPGVPGLFADLDWSTPRVFGQTLDRVESAGRSLAVLAPWYDVDGPDDWRLLADHVRALSLAGMPSDLPRLAALIDRAGP